MDNKRRLTNKYILLAILLIAVFVLPSCRTRISNNSEITTVQYDESGFMSEEYQMRRDELGLSTAEKPLLPNFGSGESDDSDDFEEGEYIDYNPEDYQEDFTETETNTNTNNNSTNSNTGTQNRSTTPSRPSPGTTTTTRYTVTFDANGGKVNGNATYKIKVKKGSKIGTLPTAKKGNSTTTTWYRKNGTSAVKSTDIVNSSITLYAHWDNEKKDDENKVKVTLDGNKGTIDGKSSKTIEVDKNSTIKSLPTDGVKRMDYTFKGWSTSKSGKPLDKSTKITPNATYFAQWEKIKKPVKVTFDPGDGSCEKDYIEVEEGSTYGTLPKATYTGHHFTGWYTQDGKKVESNTKVSKAHTLHAEWEDWNNLFEEGLPDSSSSNCFIVGDEGADLVNECMGNVITDPSEIDNNTFIIVFDDKPTKAKATGAKNEYGGKKAIVFSKDALSAEGYNQLIYKIVLVEKIYGELKYSYQDAEKDLETEASFAES